jgi:acyl carrier protein
MPGNQTVNPSDIREFIIETFLFGDRSGVQDDTSFMETGLINSMSILQVVDFIECTYGIKLEENEFVPENLDSIERIVRFLNRTVEPQKIGALIAC